MSKIYATIKCDPEACFVETKDPFAGMVDKMCVIKAKSFHLCEEHRKKHDVYHEKHDDDRYNLCLNDACWWNRTITYHGGAGRFVRYPYVTSRTADRAVRIVPGIKLRPKLASLARAIQQIALGMHILKRIYPGKEDRGIKIISTGGFKPPMRSRRNTTAKTLEAAEGIMEFMVKSSELILESLLAYFHRSQFRGLPKYRHRRHDY